MSSLEKPMTRLIRYIAGTLLLLISINMFLNILFGKNGVRKIYGMLFEMYTKGLDPELLGTVMAQIIFKLAFIFIAVFLFYIGKRQFQLARIKHNTQ